jgi:predicted dehydrogenase
VAGTLAVRAASGRNPDQANTEIRVMKKKAAGRDKYAVSKELTTRRIKAPQLPYKPARPASYRPNIGIIGCGGIAATHLEVYRKARYRVTALVDLERPRAEALRDRFYPRAEVDDTADQLLARDDIEIVDITTHPEQRVPLVAAAIKAGKHILSQKPFVTDLAVGRKLVAAARRKGVKLAVNQNGRWAAHVSYARQAIAAGLLGDINNVDLSVHWDHNVFAGTPFEKVHHLMLFDFGIHWFDMVHCYLRDQKPTSVFAATSRTISQRMKPPLSAHAVIEFPRAQASLVFRGDSVYGSQDRTIIVGTKGTLISVGPNINEPQVSLYTQDGIAHPRLTTQWFPDGFDGAMSELIIAVEEDREPVNSAADNLHSLALCFAALKSADTGKPVKVGQRP